MTSCSNTLEEIIADDYSRREPRRDRDKPRIDRRRRGVGLEPSFRDSVVLLVLIFLIGSISSSAQSSLPSDQPSSQTTPSSPQITNLPPPPTLHHNLSDISPADYVCEPIGPCQPCPIDELTNSVCEIYHNRRLVDCVYLGSSSSALIASVLRNTSTYTTGLMIHQTWIDHLPPIDSSTPPPATTPTTITTLTAKEDDFNNASSSMERLSSRAEEDENGAKENGQGQIGTGLGGAEFQSWEACERVVVKEQKDFYEFALCNLAIAAISLIVYGFRTKQLVIKQYGKLAARIGILPS